MLLKDKLELAWKYLALLVITILGINAINAYNQNGNQNYGDFLSIYDGNFDKEDVQVKKEIIDGFEPDPNASTLPPKQGGGRHQRRGGVRPTNKRSGFASGASRSSYNRRR